jgi:uncharacterized coiled-coil DUF342 family protein
LENSEAPKTENYDELKIFLGKLFDEKKKRISSLRTLIEAFRDYKKARNELNEKVRENKTKRDALKTEINAVLTQFRSAKEKAEEFIHPGSIRSRIEKIEWKIQTEIMPFKKEQELTKERLQLEEELKKALEKMKEKKELNKLRTELTLKIAEERKFHEEVLKYSKESSEKHRLASEALQKIKEERKRLKEMVPEIDSLKQRLDVLRKEHFEEKQKVEAKKQEELSVTERGIRQRISDKFQVLKEKFAKKKKLTTEDLLVIQSSKEDII